MLPARGSQLSSLSMSLRVAAVIAQLAWAALTMQQCSACWRWPLGLMRSPEDCASRASCTYFGDVERSTSTDVWPVAFVAARDRGSALLCPRMRLLFCCPCLIEARHFYLDRNDSKTRSFTRDLGFG
jgi:hypothetical protein